MNDKRNAIFGIAIFTLVMISFFGKQIAEILSQIEINPPVVVDPDLDIPNSDKLLVDNIVGMEISGSDASQIHDFFVQLADVVLHDDGLIATTGQFREFNRVAGGLNFGGLEMKNKYPDLGEEIDDLIMQALGPENSGMDASKRSKLVRTLNAIAWAVTQK